jgi:hypothetical protein
MTEHYLHYLWQNKLLPFNKLRLTDGSIVSVKNPGNWNRYGDGPDFLHAEIAMHGLIWVGHVEMHVYSSDWYKHKHHEDAAYNSVILHVVYSSSGTVRIQNDPIPELALEAFIDPNHYRSFCSVKMKPTLYCAKHVSLLDKAHIGAAFTKAFQSRILRRATVFSTKLPLSYVDQLYQHLAKAIGGKQNQIAFLELINRVPLHLFLSLSQDKQDRIYCVMSGLFSIEQASDLEIVAQLKSYNMEIMSPNYWRSGGMFASAAPQRRVEQFSIIVRALFSPVLNENLLLNPQYKTFIHFINKQDKSQSIPLTLLRHLFINAIVPVYVSIHLPASFTTVKAAKQALELIPSEGNHIVQLWKKAGIKSKNAFESQAMLEIYSDFCSRKRCLTCAIGRKILKV